MNIKLNKHLCISAMLLTGLASLIGATAGFQDSEAFVIREGGTTAVSTNYVEESFSLTANSGGKAVIAIDAMSGSQVGALRNLSFASEGSTDQGFPYFNFWVSDGGGNYAFVAINALNAGGGGEDMPVYHQQVAPGGMDRQSFQSLQVRVYGTNAADLSWIAPDVVQGSKFGSWTQALWKSNDAQSIDPITVGDIAHLQILSPFAGNEHLPSIGNPPEWTFAGTGEPQLGQGLYLVTGDTSASNTGSFVISDLSLEYDAAAATETTGGASVSTQSISTGGDGGAVEIGGGYYATASTQVESGGTVAVTDSGILKTNVISIDVDSNLSLSGSSVVEADGGNIDGAVDLGDEGKLVGGNSGLVLNGFIGGSGTLANLSVTGDVSVGSSPGHMNFEGVTFESGSTLFMEIEGADAGQFDTVTADDQTDFSGAHLTILFVNYEADVSESFQLFFGSADLSAFNTIDTPDGWFLNTETGYLQVVPEPRVAALLLGLFAFGFAFFTRRSRR
jgi:hypothetical protein